MTLCTPLDCCETCSQNHGLLSTFPKGEQPTIDTTFIGVGVGVGVFLILVVCISVMLILVVVAVKRKAATKQKRDTTTGDDAYDNNTAAGNTDKLSFTPSGPRVSSTGICQYAACLHVCMYISGIILCPYMKHTVVIENKPRTVRTH